MEGEGRNTKINPITVKARQLIGALHCGLGVRHAAIKLNELGVSPDKNSIGKSSVADYPKNIFVLLHTKHRIIKTVSHNKNSA